LSQARSSCNLTAKMDMYTWGTRDGMSELSEAMEDGVTPVVSYWRDDTLQWLDGLGKDGNGPCVVDAPAACPMSMMLSNFAIADHEMPMAALKPDVIDTALSATQKKEAELQASKNKKEFIEATSAHEPCIGECSFGEGEASHEGETSSNNVHWEVLFKMVPSRSKPSFTAEILSFKTRGAMLFGAVANDWLHLRGGGFVAVKKHQRVDAIFLARRMVTYKKLSSGFCEESKMRPIYTEEMCQDAAFALGYLDTYINAYVSVNKKPYGCYLMHGEIFFVSHPANSKNPVGKRNMICVNSAYTPNGAIEV